MGYQKITLLGAAVLLILEGCCVFATSLVSSSETSVSQTAAIGSSIVGGGGSCGQFVIPAIIKPILQSEYSAALTPSYSPSLTPSVPSFSNFPSYYPPIVIDGGDNDNRRSNHLLYYLILAMNRRGGSCGCNSGGCGCGGGYSGGCGCGGGSNYCGYSGCGCGYNNGYNNGCGCNSGCTYGYSVNPVSSGASVGPTVVDAINGEDIVIQTCPCQSGYSCDLPLNVIIKTGGGDS